jgi:hypothetical protein
LYAPAPVDVVGADDVPGLLVGEVEQDAVGKAVLERDGLRPARVRDDVLARVDVRADVVVGDDEVARGQRVHAELRRTDALGELGVALVDAQRRRRHAREREHVAVHRHREVDDPSHLTPSGVPFGVAGVMPR